MIALFFLAAESESPDGSLENPWDEIPVMTLSTSSGEYLCCCPTACEESCSVSLCTRYLHQWIFLLALIVKMKYNWNFQHERKSDCFIEEIKYK